MRHRMSSRSKLAISNRRYAIWNIVLIYPYRCCHASASDSVPLPTADKRVYFLEAAFSRRLIKDI